MGAEGHRTAVVEPGLIGGSCPNIACLPSENVIRSASVASLTRRAPDFRVELESAVTGMAGVQALKRAMVDGERQFHLDRYQSTGLELIIEEATFDGPRAVEVDLAGGGTRRSQAGECFSA
jgi:pyruvate/2-oxoglutarate dehydrogenase complex dihydrolipoamide dehydrogenase (E3) component